MAPRGAITLTAQAVAGDRVTINDGAVIGTTQIFGSAPPARAFNLVLLAEGFTATP